MVFNLPNPHTISILVSSISKRGCFVLFLLLNQQNRRGLAAAFIKVNGLHLLLLNYSVLSDLQIFFFFQFCVYLYLLFSELFSHLGYYRMLSRVPCAIQQVPVSYLYSSMYMSVSNSQSIPPPHFPPVTKNSFSKSVSLFLTDILFPFIHQVYFMSAVCKAIQPNYSCLF